MASWRLPLGGHAIAECARSFASARINFLLRPDQSRNRAADSAHSRRCGGRAGRASCGGPLRCSFRSHSAMRISSLSWDASAMMRPKGSAQERAAPELDAALRAIAAMSPFVAHAVDRGDVDAVGDGVRALNGSPGVVLRRAEFRLLRRMPADGRGVEEHVRRPAGR